MKALIVFPEALSDCCAMLCIMYCARVCRASNQRAQGGPDAVPASDQANPHPKQSDPSTKQAKTQGGGGGGGGGKTHSHGSSRGGGSGSVSATAEHSGSPHSRSGSKRTHKDPSHATGAGGGGRHEALAGEENVPPLLRSNSRPGSISPNTQKVASGHHVRTSDSAGSVRASRSGGEAGERTIVVTTTTTHSSGSSITQSLTPNLSPHSTLSTSSSSGSLRQEVEEGAEPHTRRAADGGSGVEGVAPGGRGNVLLEHVQAGRRDVGVYSEPKEQVLERREELQILTQSDSRPPREGVVGVAIPEPPPTRSLPPPVAVLEVGGVVGGVEGAGSGSPPISSPPGLSKNRTQPLSLSMQSERVCRQLDLTADPSPSPLPSQQNASLPSRQHQHQHGVEMVGRGVVMGGANQAGGTIERGKELMSNSNHGEH